MNPHLNKGLKCELIHASGRQRDLLLTSANQVQEQLLVVNAHFVPIAVVQRHADVECLTLQRLSAQTDEQYLTDGYHQDSDAGRIEG